MDNKRFDFFRLITAGTIIFLLSSCVTRKQETFTVLAAENIDNLSPHEEALSSFDDLGEPVRSFLTVFNEHVIPSSQELWPGLDMTSFPLIIRENTTNYIFYQNKVTRAPAPAESREVFFGIERYGSSYAYVFVLDPHSPFFSEVSEMTTCVHEFFHLFYQDDLMSAVQKNTGESIGVMQNSRYPENTELRYYRAEIYKALRGALHGETDAERRALTARALWFYQLQKVRYPDESKQLTVSDLVEGTAEYVGNRAAIIAYQNQERPLSPLECERVESESSASAEEQIWSMDDFPADIQELLKNGDAEISIEVQADTLLYMDHRSPGIARESYDIGNFALALCSWFDVDDPFSRVMRGEHPLDMLAQIIEPVESSADEDVKKSVEDHYGALNDSRKIVVEKFDSMLSDPDYTVVQIPHPQTSFSSSFQDQFYVQDGSGMYSDFSLTYSVDGAQIALSSALVQEKTIPSGLSYIVCIPDQHVIFSDGAVSIESKTLSLSGFEYSMKKGRLVIGEPAESSG